MTGQQFDDRIDAIVSGPAEMQGDEGRVKQQDINQVIAAEKWQATKAAAKKPNRGLRRSKMIQPGMI